MGIFLRKNSMILKSHLKSAIQTVLGILGYKLVRKKSYEDYREYIPLHSTLDAAQTAGLSIGDYIDVTFNVPGVTQETISLMKDLGVFNGIINRVCEIGPGTGRYLEKVLSITQPSYYEVYETSESWKAWLVQKYGVVAQPTDGYTLAHTPSNSIDLLQSHKVMPGQPSLVMCKYFEEMSRVVKSGGKIVFDIVTEGCMDDETLKEWQATGAGYQHYPALMCKQFVIEFFARRSCQFNSSFIVPMKPGKTECMIFTKL